MNTGDQYAEIPDSPLNVQESRILEEIPEPPDQLIQMQKAFTGKDEREIKNNCFLVRRKFAQLICNNEVNPNQIDELSIAISSLPELYQFLCSYFRGGEPVAQLYFMLNCTDQFAESSTATLDAKILAEHLFTSSWLKQITLGRYIRLHFYLGLQLGLKDIQSAILGDTQELSDRTNVIERFLFSKRDQLFGGQASLNMTPESLREHLKLPVTIHDRPYVENDNERNELIRFLNLRDRSETLWGCKISDLLDVLKNPDEFPLLSDAKLTSQNATLSAYNKAQIVLSGKSTVEELIGLLLHRTGFEYCPLLWKDPANLLVRTNNEDEILHVLNQSLESNPNSLYVISLLNLLNQGYINVNNLSLTILNMKHEKQNICKYVLSSRGEHLHHYSVLSHFMRHGSVLKILNLSTIPFVPKMQETLIEQLLLSGEEQAGVVSTLVSFGYSDETAKKLVRVLAQS